MHIYALNGAAALSGVENSTIDNICGRVRQICVGADICRVVATEFQVQWQDSTGRCLAQAETSLRRSDERDQLDLGDLDNLIEDLPCTEVDHLQNILGQTSLFEEGGEAVPEQRGLRRGTEDYGVSGEERRDESVDGDQIGVLLGKF